jgi:hypothetical protein
VIAYDIVSAKNAPTALKRSSRARTRRANRRARSASSMMMGLACCRRAAINCDLRNTRTGTSGGGFGDAEWM